MSYLLLRNISGQWDHRRVVRPNYVCWNFQDHPYIKAPIPKPESGTVFSCLKHFRFHARRTGGKQFTNFKVERGAYPQSGMTLWYQVQIWGVAEAEDADEHRRDPYVSNYFPASVGLGEAPNMNGFTGQEVPLQGTGTYFDEYIYERYGFVGGLVRMCLGVDYNIAGTGIIDGPEIHFSYQEL